MGCGKAKLIAIEELKDIISLLQTENKELEEEREKLLYEQIDKPTDDKEIIESLKSMKLALERRYREVKTLLEQLIDVISKQKETNPNNRISQISELRQNLENTYKRIDSLYLQLSIQTLKI
jgi:serine/threonine protein kinase